ncbi:MAG: hypothetical protein M3487_05580 [Actinomycetota bacterium]|nr:hypothetical protein [Actinomycetota bacterium]
MTAPRIGIFGGSGFYDFFDEAETLNVETPFGPPAGLIPPSPAPADPIPSFR